MVTDDRVPPCNIEAEMSALGCILLHPETANMGLRILAPEDFYDAAHKLIFEAMLAVHEQGLETDPVVVANELERQGKLEAIGGPVYLAKLDDSVPTIQHAPQYYQIVLEKSARRKAIAAAHDLAAAAYDGVDLGEMIQAVQGIPDMLRLPTEDTYDQAGLLNRAISALERRDDEREHFVTTWKAADDALGGGLLRGELAVIAGWPTSGKTAWACQMLLQNVERGQRCTFVSYEMPDYALVHRLMSRDLEMPSGLFRRGFKAFSAQQWDELQTWCQNHLNAPFYILDNSRITLEEIPNLLRRYKSDIVFLDFLQRMPEPRKAGREQHQRIGYLVKELANLAKHEGRVVVLLSQLSRTDVKSERQDLPRPRLDMLRGSGEIEQSANVVLFIHKRLEADEWHHEARLAKSRDGQELPWERIRFQGEFYKLAEMEERESYIRAGSDYGSSDAF